MVAIKQFAVAGFAMFGMLQTTMAYSAETPMEIGIRSVLAEPAGGMSEVDKRFWGLALKAGGRLLKAGVKAVKGKRDIDDQAIDVRDVVDALAQPLALNRRYADDDLPVEVRAVMDGTHPDLAVMDKRFWGLALKAGGRLLRAGVKAVKGKRSIDDEMDMKLRDIMDDSPVVEFQLRNLDEELPMEVRAVMYGGHPELTVVNKRFWGLALKAGGRLLKAGVKAVKGKRDFDEEDFYYY